jgi:hypothetical protein
MLRDNSNLLDLLATSDKFSPRENANSSEPEDSDKATRLDAEIFPDGFAAGDTIPTFETANSEEGCQ